uniref:Matrix remodeling associated 5 n=1 Tax=Sander lucioperca TaxID=283035 RepID=A0A8C9XA72_SANLU
MGIKDLAVMPFYLSVQESSSPPPGEDASITSIEGFIGLLLHCLTNAKPFRLTWTLPSGVVLNRPQRAGRYAVLANGTLSIHQVSVYDRGLYGCRAANEYGSSQLSVIVLFIMECLHTVCPKNCPVKSS